MNTTVSIRTDKKLKAQAEKIFEMIGLNMSSAFNAFLKAVVREKGIPFDLKIHEPNDETIDAINEGRRIANDKNIKAYTNMKQMWKKLGV